MRFPSKIFQYRETVFFDCSVIMNELNDEMTIGELYKTCKSKCNDLQGFLDALDVLYAIKKIDYNYATRRVCHAEGNNL